MIYITETTVSTQILQRDCVSSDGTLELATITSTSSTCSRTLTTRTRTTAKRTAPALACYRYSRPAGLRMLLFKKATLQQ